MRQYVSLSSHCSCMSSMNHHIESHLDEKKVVTFRRRHVAKCMQGNEKNQHIPNEGSTNYLVLKL